MAAATPHQYAPLAPLKTAQGSAAAAVMARACGSDVTADLSSLRLSDSKAGSAAGTPRKAEAVGAGTPLAPQLSLSIPEMPNLKQVMALSLCRSYTDDDWFAAMSALERVKKLQQARALASLRAAHRSTAPHCAAAVAEDDTEAWYDARSHTMSDSSVAFISDAEREEVARLAAELESQERTAQQLTVVRELEPPTAACVPNPPLLFAERHWRYRPVDIRPFCFYWERDPMRSSPFPLPIDEQMKLNSLFQRTHQSIPGMWLREEGNQMLLHATPTLLAIPGIVNYTEYYNKDQSPASWTLRRDIKVGKTTGQMFMTEDGLLILRVFTSGMFSKTIEWVGEDYIRLEDGGATIVTRQLCKMHTNGSVGTQFLIGRKVGPTPPRRSASTSA